MASRAGFFISCRNRALSPRTFATSPPVTCSARPGRSGSGDSSTNSNYSIAAHTAGTRRHVQQPRLRGLAGRAAACGASDGAAAAQTAEADFLAQLDAFEVGMEHDVCIKLVLTPSMLLVAVRATSVAGGGGGRSSTKNRGGRAPATPPWLRAHLQTLAGTFPPSPRAL